MVNDNDRMGADRLPSFDRVRGWARSTREHLPLEHLRGDLKGLRDQLRRFRDRVEPAVSDRFKSSWPAVQAGWRQLTAPSESAVPAPAVADEPRSTVRAYRNAFIGLGVASGLINVLMLTVPIFMLQIYDRVLPSRSLPTLVGLGLLAVAMLAFQGLLDLLRGRLLLRVGRGLNERLSGRVFEAVMRLPLQKHTTGDGLQPIRDLDNVRSFTASVGLVAFLDLPWMPLYVVVCFLFHPWMGISVLVGAILICSLTLVTEKTARAPSQATAAIAASRHVLAESARRNAAVIHALGMRGRMTALWTDVNERYLATHQSASDLVTAFGSLSRVLRMAVQCAVLAVGAYLVINQEATAGIMLAATILSARALAPVELAIANWKSFVTARQSWRHLADVFAAVPPVKPQIELPLPARNLRLVSVTVVPPAAAAAALHDVSFSLAAGQVLGVIGPSGSGKSALARALVGIWRPVRGTLRLDAATLDQWNADARGRFIGYLPQEIDLFDGTVAQNIARFDPKADPTRLITAAIAAGVHEIILRLPQGYESHVGEGGSLLSGGQRQRIALARALYGDPFLMVLDEPNSNLDTAGEQALTRAIQSIRARRGVAIVIAHRPNIVAVADQLLVLNEGRMQAFGPRENVLAQLRPTPPAQPAAQPTEAHAVTAASRRKAR
jgi:ATP-binding cassette subfamily C protein